MVCIVLTVTAFAGLATLVSSSNVKTTEEELLDRIASKMDRWYIFLEENFATEQSSSETSIRSAPTTDAPSSANGVTDPDPLSVVWYLGAFGGLIAFFLVVTFSEWCCASKHLYRRHGLAAPYLTGYSTESRAPETPPPPYHLFAPPPYAEVTTCCEKTAQTPIYIIPVHQSPPSATLPPPPPPPPPPFETLA
ncbi:uncharacterized protein [Rhodnius prolixus]|uniref:Uncharacterized protein n=1 Tax=Rhodnius prolixus TaxID=13249 RepID=T1HRS6_RHOPR